MYNLKCILNFLISYTIKLEYNLFYYLKLV